MTFLFAPSALAQVCDPATNAAAVREAREALKKIRESFDFLGQAGLPVPNVLKIAANAVEAGVNLGEAAGELDAYLQEIDRRKERLCELAYPSGDDWQDVCKAQIARLWQARNVKAVLNWSDSTSLLRRAARKWTGSRCDRNAPTPVPPQSSRPVPPPPPSPSFEPPPTPSGTPPIRGACRITGTC